MVMRSLSPFWCVFNWTPFSFGAPSFQTLAFLVGTCVTFFQNTPEANWPPLLLCDPKCGSILSRCACQPLSHLLLCSPLLEFPASWLKPQLLSPAPRSCWHTDCCRCSLHPFLGSPSLGPNLPRTLLHTPATSHTTFKWGSITHPLLNGINFLDSSDCREVST